MLYADGTFDTSYYGRTVPYLYHLESDESLGLFGIGIGAAFDIAKAIAGGAKPSGCVNSGPQKSTRDIMRRIVTVNADAYSRGLPIHEPTFTMLRAVASGEDRQGFDCPRLAAAVGEFLAVYDQNRLRMQGGGVPYLPPPIPPMIPGAPTAGPTPRPAGPAPGAAPATAPVPGWVVPAAIGGGVLLFVLSQR